MKIPISFAKIMVEDQMSSTIAADIEIRSPRAEEAAAIAEHNVLMARETENKELDLLVVQKGVAAVINDPTKGFFIVAVASDGHILGNVMVTSEWSDWRNQQMWWFQSVYVRVEARRTGIFTRMFNHVKKLAVVANVHDLRLYVERENKRAQNVYKHIGMHLSHYDMFEVEI